MASNDDTQPSGTTGMQWETLLCVERPRPSTVSNDHREPFERDFDRSIFSTPVKRLQDKAQVFPLEPCDAIRTRLTHSLEVSSVARGLGISVSKWLLEIGEIKQGMDRQIEAIMATCGLIHDLGNPPFGHAGESAIREWFADKFPEGETPQADALSKLFKGNAQLTQDFRKFEGNAQTLRIVAKLQILADFHGLNLTFGTLSASSKYIARSDEAAKGHKDHARTKPGFFSSENDLIELIRAKTGTGNARNPLTFLVEAADDIVYSVADVEDGIKKCILSWAELEKMFSEKKIQSLELVLKQKDKILKAGLEAVPKDLPDNVHASAFRSAAISVLVIDAVEKFKQNYQKIKEGNYTDELAVNTEDERKTKLPTLVEELKALGNSRIYCTLPTLKLELMGRKIIYDLMELFWEGAKSLPLDGPVKTNTFAGRISALLSENYRRVFRNSVKSMPNIPVEYHRLQLVTDYVSGMTDTFAKELHAELNNG